MLVVMVMLVVVLVVGVVVLVMMMLLVVVMLVVVVVVAVHNRGSSPISLLWARKEKSLGGEMDPKSGKVLMGSGHFPETWWKTRLTSIFPNRSISNIFSAPLLQHVNTLMKEGKCKKYEMQEKIICKLNRANVCGYERKCGAYFFTASPSPTTLLGNTNNPRFLDLIIVQVFKENWILFFFVAV